MPKNFGQPFVRFTIGGDHFTADEWAITLSIIGDTVEPTQAQADAVRDAFVTNMLPHVSSFSRLNYVKAARIGADGLYTSPAPTLSIAGGATGTAGGSAQALPPQCAVAVSLLGANPRGAAGRGRFYLPAGKAMAGDGRLSVADAQQIGNSARAFVQAVNTAVPGNVGIVGPATTSGRAPARQPAVAVRVGRVIDTIRSRRSSLPEEPYIVGTAVTTEDPLGGFGGGGGDF